jgi:hypothetical protein
MNLHDWIRAPLLEASTVEHLAATLRDDPMRTVVLDDVLRPERVHGLRAVFEDEAAFTEKFQIRLPDRQFKAVPAEEWASVDEDARVERQLLLDATPRVARMSLGVAQHLRFMSVVRHPDFAGLLGRIGGIDDLVFESGEARIMRSPHIVKPHSDGRRGLCAVFYLHARWDPRCGGRLVQYERDAVRRHVEPLPNRVVVFLPGAGLRHAVEPITEVDGWQRCSYSLWFETAVRLKAEATGDAIRP